MQKKLWVTLFALFTITSNVALLSANSTILEDEPNCNPGTHQQTIYGPDSGVAHACTGVSNCAYHCLVLYDQCEQTLCAISNAVCALPEPPKDSTDTLRICTCDVDCFIHGL